MVVVVVSLEFMVFDAVAKPFIVRAAIREGVVDG